MAAPSGDGDRTIARGLYPRWIVANAVGEFVGLGGTVLVTLAVWPVLDEAALGWSLVLAALVALSGAVIEGLVVGTAQWLALKSALPALLWRPWAIATAVGAFIAWALGMLPSTLFSAMAVAADAGASDAVSVDPPLALQMALAIGMGLVLGPVLGGFQWPVLRQHVPRAGRWILANSLAWGAGMPVIFLAAGGVPPDASTLAIGATVAGALIVAGAIVGAVHGAFIVRMVREA